MRSERGQASVEWIGIVLLVAIALAALAHFAPRADGRGVATTVLHSVTHPPDPARLARRPHAIRRSSGPPGYLATGEGFMVPPLVPRPGLTGSTRGLRLPAAPRRFRPPWPAGVRFPEGLRPAWPPGDRFPQRLRHAWPRGVRLPESRWLLRMARRGVGAAWRRAWLGCLFYERARYGFLHPESRFTGLPIPRSELIRMVNDCISPVDLVRDWSLVTGR
jgi:hypothetical protein